MSKGVRKAERQRLIFFLEELSWLLRNYSNTSLLEELDGLIKSSIDHSTFDDFTPTNPNIAFLVGALPVLFMDKDLFKRNEDIALFSEKVLKIPISRYDKRSQYELIGFIVCEVSKLDDKKLSQVVKELKSYLPDRGKTQKKGAMEWNEAIRRLSGENQ